MEETVSYAVPPTAIRVFYSFRKPTLTSAQFFDQVGNTFWPGTPYLLQPLGLEAYLPAVLEHADGDGFPDEFALIVYASAEVYHAAMHDELRGRLYGQTHSGVYDLSRTYANFPQAAAALNPTDIRPYYLFGNAVDWQVGSLGATVGTKADSEQSGADFRTATRSAIAGHGQHLRDAGIDEVIAIATDSFVIVWTHNSNGDPCEAVDLGPSVVAPVTLRADRIICCHEVPGVSLASTRFVNYIFLRDSAYFLR